MNLNLIFTIRSLYLSVREMIAAFIMMPGLVIPWVGSEILFSFFPSLVFHIPKGKTCEAICSASTLGLMINVHRRFIISVKFASYRILILSYFSVNKKVQHFLNINHLGTTSNYILCTENYILGDCLASNMIFLDVYYRLAGAPQASKVIRGKNPKLELPMPKICLLLHF